MNKVILIGRLTKDPDIRYAKDSTAFARFTLAVDRAGKNHECDFIGCTAFGKTAELIGKYVSKGSKIGLDGRIRTGSYRNPAGDTVYTTSVVADSIEFLDSKKQAGKQDDDFMPVPDDAEAEGLPFN